MESTRLVAAWAVLAWEHPLLYTTLRAARAPNAWHFAALSPCQSCVQPSLNAGKNTGMYIRGSARKATCWTSPIGLSKVLSSGYWDNSLVSTPRLRQWNCMATICLNGVERLWGQLVCIVMVKMVQVSRPGTKISSKTKRWGTLYTQRQSIRVLRRCKIRMATQPPPPLYLPAYRRCYEKGHYRLPTLRERDIRSTTLDLRMDMPPRPCLLLRLD